MLVDEYIWPQSNVIWFSTNDSNKKNWEVLGKLCILENFKRYIDSTKEYTKYIYKYL